MGLRSRFVYHQSVGDLQSKAAKLADIMGEFGLSEACIEGDDWKVAFRKRSFGAAQSEPVENRGAPAVVHIAPEAAPAPQGHPISSPMTGIYYSASSPSSPPFVQEGDTVEVGQVVALIEAMKVFNEITSNVAGRVLSLHVENGALVNPGEPLMHIG